MPAQFVGSPISANTAQTLTDMLAVSLEQESSSALLPGYRLAGKTGTAQIPTAFGYDPDHTNASFIGWGPVDDPQFMVYVWLEEPTSLHLGFTRPLRPFFQKLLSRLSFCSTFPLIWFAINSDQDNMLTIADALEALTNFRPQAVTVITEAVIDSRQIIPGSLFVAIPGEKVDGHDFIGEAFKRGASFALIQKDSRRLFSGL